MKILCDTAIPSDVTFNDLSIICEQATPDKPNKIKIKGLYIACNCKNVNGRRYDFDYFNEDVVPTYIETAIKPHQAYAELNHAQSYNVNPKDACDIITDLHASGTNFEGESEVLNGDTRLGIPGTPNGDILAAILMHGGKIGKSTRGAVDNPKNPLIDRNNQYKLITVDTVLNPSGPGCYINDVILEEKDFMINEHGIIVECAYNQFEKEQDEIARQNILDIKKKQEALLDSFNNFLKNIR